jgi:hypothetical protein
MSGSFICYACGDVKALAHRDEHHRIPQSAGGTDADKIDLCKMCHQGLHALAYAFKNPKRKGEIDHILSAWARQETKAKIAELAMFVVKAEVAKADTPENFEDEEKTITFPLTKKEYLKILFAAKDRRVSVSNFVKDIVLKQVEKLL